MLYRTVANLAFFFDIPIDTLLEETPFSLLEYAAEQPNYSKPCIGRDLEIQQLQQLSALANNSQQIVCITGMQGLGKTHLINHFLASTKFTGQRTLYVTVRPFDNALMLLVRRMLDVEDEASDGVVRHKAKALIHSSLESSSLALFYLLRVLGVTLNDAEKSALGALKTERLEQLEQSTAITLIQHCVNNSISVIAIDDVHDAQVDCLSFIQHLVTNKAHLPFLLLLGARNIKQFTFLPDWLALAYKMDLRPLDSVTTNRLAKAIIKHQPSHPVYDQDRRQNAIERAKGHPGILEELLIWDASVSDLPRSFHQTTLQLLRSLSTEQRQLLKKLAFTGMFFSASLVDTLLANTLLKGVVHLHHLVCLGFLYPVSDGYCFRHFLIWEIVTRQINNAEKAQWCSLAKDAHTRQVSLVSDP